MVFNKGILIHFPFFQTFSPFLINYFHLETLFHFSWSSFFSISNFLISGNFLKSGISGNILDFAKTCNFTPVPTSTQDVLAITLISSVIDVGTSHMLSNFLYTQDNKEIQVCFELTGSGVGVVITVPKTERTSFRTKERYKSGYIQGVPKKKGNWSSKINYFKDTKFILVNYAL